MAKEWLANVGDNKITCPTCNSNRFAAQKHLIAKSWMQLFDVEGFGKEGLMLICVKCGRTQQFARKDLISLTQVSG